MTATTPPRPSGPARPAGAPAARLALKSESPAWGSGELDGAWWPRSRDLAAELTSLSAELDPLWGRITRIAVNPRNWPILPPRIFANGHGVRVGWFTSELDPHQLLLLSHTVGRWALLVVPPETEASVAARLLAAASAPTPPLALTPTPTRMTTDTDTETDTATGTNRAMTASDLMAAEGVTDDPLGTGAHSAAAYDYGHDCNTGTGYGYGGRQRARSGW
ncbi:DUF5994 family protein [Streptomyces sp. NPDC058417]|uniref:DUF5994 family protein n=1 Tax=unclassified Streptomyces TaxID=2593676 RepID=UPI00365E0C93